MKYGNITLGQIEAGINKIGGEEAFMRLLRDELMVSEAIAKRLLERLSTTIAIPAVEQFTAAEHFVINTSEEAKVKISGFGSNFSKHFLSKIEKGGVAAEELAVNKLLEDAFDSAIITVLGGEAKIEITLGQFFAAFTKQPNGEDSPLLTNRYANIGYVRDDEGVLWAVGGGWSDDGWYFGAYPLDGPFRWRADRQVLSR